MKSPVRVTITGAAGQIGYQLAFRIASGQMLGDMALGVEQRLRNHPFDRTDARYDDAPSSALA